MHTCSECGGRAAGHTALSVCESPGQTDVVVGRIFTRPALAKRVVLLLVRVHDGAQEQRELRRGGHVRSSEQRVELIGEAGVQADAEETH